MHLEIISRNSILESGNIVESYNPSHPKQIIEFLKAYKYRRTNVSYRKLDNMDCYTIKIVNNEKEVFRAAIRGDRYISLIDKSGKWLTYKVTGNKLNVKILKDIYKTLSAETYDVKR
jgi:hypothetical protein